MIKKLLSIMLFLAMVGMVSAQSPVRRDFNKPQHLTVLKSGQKNMKAMKARAMANKTIRVGNDQMWFGYGNDAEAENMGLAIDADYNLAVYIPCEKIAARVLLLTVFVSCFHQPRLRTSQLG